MDITGSLNVLQKTLKEVRFYNKGNESVDFIAYSHLPDYERKTKGDEDIVVTPILIKILDTLGYSAGVNLIQQGAKGGDKPDFRTFTNNLFILDAKSTSVPILPVSSNNSETPSEQIKRYLKAFEGYKYGILFNLVSFEFYMRDWDANGNLTAKHVPEKQIHLPSLFTNLEQKNFSGKDYENYTWFFQTFRYKEITKEEYAKEIKARVKEDLIKPDKELLKATVYNSLKAIRLDIQNQVQKVSENSYEWEQLDFELQKIKFEFKIKNKEEENQILKEEFIKQASYVLLIKLVLIRILEDNDLVPKNLYNGGFKMKSEPPFSMTLKKILRDSNIEASELIPSFFEESVYNYFIEDETSFIEILFELSKINFSEIDFDLIGDLYEHYLNYEERKEKGQYYTPHYIVEFILNRVGFSAKNFSKIENKTLLDPACGSGGFLVEAARRIRKLAVNREGDGKSIIANHLFGTELTAFASFLCEVNLIVQILPLVKRLPKDAQKKIHTLNVYRKDSLLEIYNHTEIERIASAIDLHVTASPKEKKFIQLKNKNDFDFVVGNPPYVGESGHKDIFRPLQVHEYWKRYYQGKSDYLYYFIILGLSKLKEGGKFAFITTQYWLTADGASNLRKFILENSKILEIIDFKGIKLFPEAKGQENIVFVLEKSENDSERKNHPIKIIQFHKDWVSDPTETITSQKTVIRNFDRWQSLLLNSEQFELFADPKKENFTLGRFKRNEIADVYYSAILQGELDEKAWYIYKKEKDSIQLSENVLELQSFCNINQGVVPGPVDTKKIIKKLSSSTIQKFQITENEGVFVLSSRELEEKKIEKSLVYPFHKNSDIKKSFLNFSSKDYLIYTPKIDSIENFPNFQNHIERYYEYLITRREVELERIRWFDLWWSREESLFESEKIMISYRTHTNSFAYTNYPFYSATDTYYINKKENINESLKYIYGILISDSILKWLKDGNCKMKGDAFELFTTSVSKIPIPKIDFENPRAKAIHDFIGGDYSTSEKEKYLYHEPTNTFIQKKGLTDFIIEWTKELYTYQEMGFVFDIEKLNGDRVSFDYGTIAKNLSNENELERAESFTIFDSHIFDPEIIQNAKIYFKNTPKDFIIKECIEIIGLGHSLVEPDNELKKHGFHYLLTFKSKTKEPIHLEVKGKELAEFLFSTVGELLKNQKEIHWDSFKTIILPQKDIDKQIDNILINIKIFFSNENLNQIKEISTSLDLEKLEGTRSIRLVYDLLNSLVNELFLED